MKLHVLYFNVNCHPFSEGRRRERLAAFASSSSVVCSLYANEAKDEANDAANDDKNGEKCWLKLLDRHSPKRGQQF